MRNKKNVNTYLIVKNAVNKYLIVENAVNKNVKYSVMESCKYHISLGMRTFARFFLPIALPI